MVRANAAPVVTTRSAIAIEDTPLVFTIASLLANASDADDNALSLVFAGATSGARVVIDRAAGTVTYTPKLNATGSDRLLYGVSDGKVTTNGVIDLTISPVNERTRCSDRESCHAPCGPDHAFGRGTAGKRYGRWGSALSIVGVTPVINGTVSFNAATGEICSFDGRQRRASFTYTVSDGEKQSVGQVWFFIDSAADLFATEIDTPRDIPLGSVARQ